jgi:hypothetical protein
VVRYFGGPWLGLQLVEQLGLKDSLDRTIPDGREEIPWSPDGLGADSLPPLRAVERIAQRVPARILVCFLAYVLWKALSQRCQRAGLGHESRRVFEDLGKIQLVDVVLPTGELGLVYRLIIDGTYHAQFQQSIGNGVCVVLGPASRRNALERHRGRSLQ